MERSQKVVAHTVRRGRLLVFVHADDERLDESGVQVPAGTVRPARASRRPATPIRFELYWIPLAQAHVLAAGRAR
jgi:hypothetical protein